MKVWFWVAALLIASLAPATADERPGFEAALESAKRAGKPLVIEFHAAWCKPCRYFEEHVLKHRDVIEALRGVELVRYDLDSTLGAQVAERLGVIGVPTFLVIDASGNVAARYAGLGGDRANVHRWFIELLRAAAQQTRATRELEHTIAVNPDDANARLLLARQYRAAGRIDDATTQYTWIVEHAERDRGPAMAAAAERDDMVNAEARVAAVIESADRFVESFPDAPASSARIAILALSKRVPRARLEALVTAHLQAVSMNAWPDAVRAALIAESLTAARDSIARYRARMPNDVVVDLVEAEVLMHSGERFKPIPLLRRACRAGTPHELWCFLLRETRLQGVADSPSIVQMRQAAEAYLLALAVPGKDPRYEYTLVALLGEHPQFGNAVARALQMARVYCHDAVERGGSMVVILDLATRGRPLRVQTRSGLGVALDRCVRRVLAAVMLPAPPHEIAGHLHATLYFAPGHRPVDQQRRGPTADLMPRLVSRFGAVETYAFGARFMVNVKERVGFGTTALAIAGEVELGTGDAGKPTWVARGFVGFNMMLGRRVRLFDLIGVGGSDLGTRAPRSFELPGHLGMIVYAGPARAHAWVGADFRDNWYHYGAGASVDLTGRRIFAGWQREHREAGTSNVVLFGIALGRIY